MLDDMTGVINSSIVTLDHMKPIHHAVAIPGHELHSAIKKDVHSSLLKHQASHQFVKESLEHIANVQPGHMPTEKELIKQA